MGPTAKLPYRKLVTTIFYPAKGSLTHGSASSSPAPSRPERLTRSSFLPMGSAAVLRVIRIYSSTGSAAGYVVAAPAFPLTSRNVPGGPNAGDVLNQPADMSFLISSMIRASRVLVRLADWSIPKRLQRQGIRMAR